MWSKNHISIIQNNFPLPNVPRDRGDVRVTPGFQLVFLTALFSAGSLGEEAEVSITHGKILQLKARRVP